MKIINLIMLFLIVLSNAHSLFAETVKVYGVREQAAGNCSILGGTLGQCTVANWKTNYQVCDCHINRGIDGIGGIIDAGNNSNSCNTRQTYGIREQAAANCSIIGGQVLSCTVANWQTQYQVCQCLICN